MVQLVKIGNSPNVPVKDYICDLLAEINDIPQSPVGSTCLCLEDKSVWIKGSENWVKF